VREVCLEMMETQGLLARQATPATRASTAFLVNRERRETKDRQEPNQVPLATPEQKEIQVCQELPA
jgi:hypothetical protein